MKSASIGGGRVGPTPDAVKARVGIATLAAIEEMLAG